MNRNEKKGKTGEKNNSMLSQGIEGFLISALFMGLGFGLCFWLHPGAFETIFLFLFGCLGVFMLYGTIRAVFVTKKPFITHGAADGIPIFDGDDGDISELPVQISVSESNAVMEGLQDAVEGVQDFYEEHKETIQKAERTVRRGKEMVSGVLRVVSGMIVAMIPGELIRQMLRPDVVYEGLPLPFVIAFLSVFVIAGIVMVVKGVKMLLGR